jgi:hypothetical protein
LAPAAEIRANRSVNKNAQNNVRISIPADFTIRVSTYSSKPHRPGRVLDYFSDLFSATGAIFRERVMDIKKRKSGYKSHRTILLRVGKIGKGASGEFSSPWG